MKLHPEHEPSYTVQMAAEMFAEKFGGKPEWYSKQLKEKIESGEIQTLEQKTQTAVVPRSLPTYSGNTSSTHRYVGRVDCRALELLLPKKMPASELVMYTVDDNDPLKILRLKDDRVKSVSTKTLNTYRHSLNCLIEIIRHLSDGGELREKLFHDDGRCNADVFQKIATDLYPDTPGRLDEKIRDAQQWKIPHEK